MYTKRCEEGQIHICAGKPDKGQVQMGSCWDARFDKYAEKYTNVKRYMLKDICKYFWNDTNMRRQTRSRPSSNGFLLGCKFWQRRSQEIDAPRQIPTATIGTKISTCANNF